jgi:hypothetical protein
MPRVKSETTIPPTITQPAYTGRTATRPHQTHAAVTAATKRG